MRVFFRLAGEFHRPSVEAITAAPLDCVAIALNCVKYRPMNLTGAAMAGDMLVCHQNINLIASHSRDCRNANQ